MELSDLTCKFSELYSFCWGNENKICGSQFLLYSWFHYQINLHSLKLIMHYNFNCTSHKEPYKLFQSIDCTVSSSWWNWSCMWDQRFYHDRSQSLVWIRIQTGWLINQCAHVSSCRGSDLNSTKALTSRATLQQLVPLFVRVYITSSLHVKTNPLLSIATCSGFNHTAQRRWYYVGSSCNVNRANRYVRDCNVSIVPKVVLLCDDVCLKGSVCDVWCCLFCNALCLEGFSLFKQANKLFFADQDIYWHSLRRMCDTERDNRLTSAFYSAVGH